MRIERWGNRIVAGVCAALLVLSSAPLTFANTAKSPNYEASEAEFGAGAALETCSGSFCAKATIGGITGESSSKNYNVDFGSLTDDSDPVLELIVEPGDSNLGDLGMDRTATRTMILNVRSHLSGGYMVQIVGTPPRHENHILAAPLEPTPSMQGTEQFAMNVVANTEPKVGGDPKLMPADEILQGVVVTKYGTPNLFAYGNGDVVARSSEESSQIRYTISMIVNVAGTTPAGHYSGDFAAVVTPDF